MGLYKKHDVLSGGDADPIAGTSIMLNRMLSEGENESELLFSMNLP